MHRDLKLSNLLFTHAGAAPRLLLPRSARPALAPPITREHRTPHPTAGELKLCDYGLARYFQPWDEAYTPGVVTLWYR